MPRITLNGEEKNLSGNSLNALLQAEGVPNEHWQGIAIARNGSVVPKSAWASVALSDGDRVEIVKPFVGG